MLTLFLNAWQVQCIPELFFQLREAANLVPKMSTPKLTNALKVTSTLQQRITETVTSRYFRFRKYEVQVAT